MCCSLDERFAEGSEFLELATTIDEKNEVTWTFRGKNKILLSKANDLSLSKAFSMS